MSSTLQPFYTDNHQIIKPFIDHYKVDPQIWVDPYGGQGHLLRAFDDKKTLCIDIDALPSPDLVLNSFHDLPYIPDCAVITNPPYAYRHILQQKDVELYKQVINAGYVDLYEFSIHRII